MRGLRASVIFGVSVSFASSAVLLAFGVYFLTVGNWVLGLTMIAGALVTVVAGIGVLRGFRPLIRKPHDGADPATRHDLPG